MVELGIVPVNLSHKFCEFSFERLGNIFMVSMSFRLKVSRPIMSAECIFPESFVLRGKSKNGENKVIEFDFKVYRYRITNDVDVDVMAKNLDISTFPGAVDLLDMCKVGSVQWTGAYIHCCKDPDSGKAVNPIGIYDVVIGDSESHYLLPDYEFAGNGRVLAPVQVAMIKKAMWDAVGFCTAHLFNDLDELVRLYENDGRVYLRTSSGEGYYLDTLNGNIGMCGDLATADKVDRVREVFSNVIEKLGEIPFPVNSVSIPVDGGTKGFYMPSIREKGAYDIVIL